MGADFNFQVPPMGSHPSLYLSQNVTFSHLLFGRVLKREGVMYPPCEGGLKVGANFNYQVSLREVTPPSLPSLVREGDKLCNKCAMTCHLKHLQKFVISDLFRNLWFVVVVNNYDCWFVILYFFRII